MERTRHKSLLLILARELATNMATPIFVVDPEGTLVYYNEPAEAVLGASFATTGELSFGEWGSRWNPSDPAGDIIEPRDLPLAQAFRDKKAAHAPMWITGLDGERRLISVTSVPLLGPDDELMGAIAIFWQGPDAARVWGSRGSLASPGPETVRYGGNTSCVEIELSDGTIVVLDAGTGIRALGDALVATRAGLPIHVLLTHLHMDHLQGLAFFAPLWDGDTELHVYGPRHPTRTLADRVANYLSEPLFPIHLSDVPSQPQFHEVQDEEFNLGNARVMAMPVSHAGPTVGYRIEDNGFSLAYISDHEPARGVDLTTLSPEWISGFPLFENVDVLIHDSQYSAEEYETHVGWGHSSIDHVVHLANTAKVGQLVLYHHDPGHSDATLEAMHVRACELWEGQATPVLAYEGMELHLA